MTMTDEGQRLPTDEAPDENLDFARAGLREALRPGEDQDLSLSEVREGLLIRIDATEHCEQFLANFNRFGDDIAAKIDAALPPDACENDPVLAERRRCAYAALSTAFPHYMSESTASAAVTAILKGDAS